MAQLAGQRHALVTSETRDLATARTRAARVRTPAVAVTAEDVTLGKPNPEVFLTAARLLRVDPAACVVEDSTNAIAAAVAVLIATPRVLRGYAHSPRTPSVAWAGPMCAAAWASDAGGRHGLSRSLPQVET